MHFLGYRLIVVFLYLNLYIVFVLYFIVLYIGYVRKIYF
jgi:hypothetical protein